MSKKPSKFWTYDVKENTLTKRNLFHKRTDQENWYEDEEGNSFEPFYTDSNKAALKKRVLGGLQMQVRDLYSQISKLTSKTVELSNR